MDGRTVKRLLIVEDNPHDLELACVALELGEVLAEVSTAPGGQEALDRLRAGSAAPDLVLLDLNMPRLSGLDVLRALKGDPALRGFRVVVFTTSDEPRDREVCLAAGADGYLLKPSGLGELIITLQALARRWLAPPGPKAPEI